LRRLRGWRSFFVSLGAGPPTAAEVDRFVKAAAEYGRWMATAEENQSIGISLP
jgi:hypothetical protein